MITRLTLHAPSDLPPVKPSAIALGTLFNHAASLAVLGPVFGDTYRRAQAANSNEEFFKSKEAASAGAAWGTSLVGSAVQAYGVGALINATGTLSYKGAAYLGALIFAASSAPSVCSQSSSSRWHMALTVALVHRTNYHREASPRHRCRWRSRPRLRDCWFVAFPHLLGNSHQPIRLPPAVDGKCSTDATRRVEFDHEKWPCAMARRKRENWRWADMQPL